MRWFKKHLGNVGMASVSMLFLLTCLALIPLSSVSAHEGTSAVATPTTVLVQLTPAVDATVTALTKEQLVHENDWWWNYGATILTSLISTFTLAAAGIFTVIRYFNDRRDAREKQEAEAKRLAEDRQAEREKRTEERFQTAVTGLGDDKEGTRIGAAILLRTFLHPGYEQFYTQTFDLVVANLRLPRTSDPAEANPDTSSTLTTLRQALIVVFKEAFPLARSQSEENTQSLDASHVQLDNAYIGVADLKQASMRQASLRNVTFIRANLSRATLIQANLSGANILECNLSETRLVGANLSKGILFRVDLSKADLLEANLSETDLRGANLCRAYCCRANLSKANLSKASSHMGDLSGVNLSKASFRRANLSGADLSEANLSEADLSEANLGGANLSRATLSATKLIKAQLCLAMFFKGEVRSIETDVSGAKLKAGKAKSHGIEIIRVKLRGAHLNGADLSGAKLIRADLRDADLSGVKFHGAEFIGVKLCGARLDGANLEDALSLTGSNLRKVTGLSKEQLAACKAKGAIIDEDPTTSVSQSTAAPASLQQSNDTQAPSAPPSQESTLPPDPVEATQLPLNKNLNHEEVPFGLE